MQSRHLTAAVFACVLLTVCLVFDETVRAENAEDSSKSETALLPQVSGFIDVRGVHSSDSATASQFMIGQAELDLEQHIASRVDYLLAICYNNDTEAFELGAAELHLSLLSTPRKQLSRAELIAGRFDVPFGIDYRYAASPDCELVCSPWYAHAVGNCNAWNDLGIRLTAGNNRSELDLYIVNGYEESAEIVQTVYNLATGISEDSVMELKSNPQAAWGGRLGILPVGRDLEIGFSAATGIDEQGALTMKLLCGDVAFSASRWRVQAELIYSSLSEGGLLTISRGCYLQLRRSIAGLRLVGRCAASCNDQETWLYQFSGGAAIPIATGTELRAEFIRTPGDRVISLFQIVAGF